MAAVTALAPDVLLLQEHEVGVAFPGYTPEGTSVLFKATAGPAEACRGAWQLDIGDGKSAAFAVAASGTVFVSVHLRGGPGSADAKRRQLEMVLGALSEHAGPCVIAGDMNDVDPAANLDATLGTAGFVRVPPAGPTGLTSDLRTELCLDHVYLRGVKASAPLALPYAVENPWLPGAILGSDHAPVMLEIVE
jgi:endonuclease/exonuclease/phosphatase (EEP) superfamily protein YafD